MIVSHVNHDLYAELIDQLVARRKSLGLTQREVDDLIGCADGLVGKWECGIRTPKPRSFAEWSKALGGNIMFVSD
jgi:transcriptional regulator with XRE-family HTH domain